MSTSGIVHLVQLGTENHLVVVVVGDGPDVHSPLAALESPAEPFFMNVGLVRVLYAHALVLDGDLALGRPAFLARLIGHPRSRGPQALLSMKDVLPERYPIQITQYRSSSTASTGST
jgi:hypothetical protein